MALEPLKNYWTTVFENCEILQDELKEADKPIMNHCQKLEFSKGTLQSTFTFTFASNPFFSNDSLTKTVYFTDPQTPSHSVGTEIKWNSDQDVTKKVSKKKQRNKKTGQTRVVEKTEKEDSFFNFFGSIDMKAIDDLDDEEAQQQEDQMNCDLDIAGIMEDEAITYSLEYFLGVAKKDDDDEEGDDDDDDSDSEEEKPK